jgi:two-component system, chemotaxis family, sensor kinase CheA
VTSGRQRYVIPQVNLQELVRLEGDGVRKSIESTCGVPVLRRRGRLLPLVYMNEVLGLERDSAKRNGDVVNIIVVQAEDRQFGLVVESVLDTQEIVVKPLGKQLKKVDCFAGATIMGDGGVALIVDVARIGRKAGIVLERGEGSREELDPERQASSATQTYLLFRAGGLRRAAVPLPEVSRLEEFPQSSIEFAGGRPVIQYRGEILPLISLAQVLGSGGSDAALHCNPVHVVVFRVGNRSIGLVVDQIIDIATDAVEPVAVGEKRGVLRSTRIERKVTDLLDLPALLASCGSELLPDLAQSLDALRGSIGRGWEQTETVETVQ